MMGMSMGHRQEVRQEARLTQSQSIAVSQLMIQRRLDLISSLHGEQYEPKATCPACGYGLTNYEILKGFNDSPTDYTTGCPKCKHRFGPKLRHSTNSGSTEVAFYCPGQTLAQLPGLEQVPLDEIKTKHAAVFRSAVTHFGGLKQAFEQCGITYAFAADLDWKNQIGPFLGKLPDTVVAELAGAPLSTVRKLRKERGIPSFSRREEAESIS